MCWKVFGRLDVPCFGLLRTSGDQLKQRRRIFFDDRQEKWTASIRNKCCRFKDIAPWLKGRIHLLNVNYSCSINLFIRKKSSRIFQHSHLRISPKRTFKHCQTQSFLIELTFSLNCSASDHSATAFHQHLYVAHHLDDSVGHLQ